VDLTLELGQEKAMVIYGLSQESYQRINHQEKRALRHTDGEILMMEVLSQATGEVIKDKLELLSQTVGIPQQILGEHRRCAFGEHGSNLKKGIFLYQEEHPDVLQIQQTELSFLTPPHQRSQCRYFNTLM
jgi:hypothetical protein